MATVKETREILELELEKVKARRTHLEYDKKIAAAKGEEKSLLREEQKITDALLEQKKEELSVQSQINKELDKTMDMLGIKMPKALRDIVTNTKSFSEQMKAVGKAGLNVLNVLTSWKGALGLITTAFAAVIDAEEKVNQYMREWVRATASVAKEVGGMTKQWPEVKRAIGETWGIAAKYGMSVQEAADHVKDIVMAFSSTSDIKEWNRTALEFSQGLGLGSAESGKLLFSLKKAGQSLTDIKKIEGDIINISKKMGIPISQIAKDMASADTKLAAFGKEGVRTMPAMVAYARQMGMSFETMYKSMEGFDKLSSGADISSKLGAIFGIQINAIEMLVETDPAKRLEKVRDTLLSSNKEWKNMNYYEVKALSQSLNLSEKEVSMIFKKENQYKSVAQIQKELDKENIDRKKAEENRQKNINKILQETSTLFRDLGPQVRSFYMALDRAFKPLYDTLFGSRKGLLEGMTKFFNNLARDETWKNVIKGIAESIKYLGDMLKKLFEGMTPDKVKNLMIAYGAIVGLRTVGGIGGSLGLNNLGAGMGGKTIGAIGNAWTTGKGPIAGMGRAGIGAAGAFGVSSLINAGLGGMGLEKMGSGAVAGGSAGAGIGGMFGGLPGMIGGYGLGLMGGTAYDTYSRYQNAGKAESMSSYYGRKRGGVDASRGSAEKIMDNIENTFRMESDFKKRQIGLIQEELKAGKDKNNLNEEQKKLLNELNPKWEKTGINFNELNKKMLAADKGFDALIEKLNLMKPTKEEIDVQKSEMEVNKLKHQLNKFGSPKQQAQEEAKLKELQNAWTSKGGSKGDWKHSIGGVSMSKDQILEEYNRLLQKQSEKDKIKEQIMIKEDILEDKKFRLSEKLLNLTELKLLSMEFREQNKDLLTSGSKEAKEKAWEEKIAHLSPEQKALARGAKPFASGGIVSSPTIALIGERGPEKITPLSGGSSGGGTVYLQPIELKINERVLGQALIRIANSGG